MLDAIRKMMFDSGLDILRVLLVGTLAYVALVSMLRVSGKRTLSKMNAFDLVVTVALGSTLATVLLTSNVALAEGLTALALLITLQYAVAWIAVRSERFNRWIKAEPVMVFYQGRFLLDAMKRERVTKDEVLAAIREQRFESTEAVEAVVLESAGTFSVVAATGKNESSTLASIRSHQGS